MRNVRKLVVLGAVLGATLGVLALTTAPATEAAASCANVRCAGCPDGYHLLLKWPNCCKCVQN